MITSLISDIKRLYRQQYFVGNCALLCGALALSGCDQRPASTPATPPAPASAKPAAPAPASAAPSPVAAPTSPASALIGVWRQICQPFAPGDGASDITYTISLQGTDKLKLEGVAKDYKNVTCSGGGIVIATPVFVQKISGAATVDGVTVIKLVDDGASANSPLDTKSVAGIDKGQLRFGNAKGSRDGEGFPSQLEKPNDAYNKLQ